MSIRTPIEITDELPHSQIDDAIDDIIAHELTIRVGDNDLWPGGVERFQGIPMNTDKRIDKSPFLWIWQGATKYEKPGVAENCYPEGTTDLIFLLAQYIPTLDNGAFRTDILQRKNALIKKFFATLKSTAFVDATADAMTYDTGKWYFLGGKGVFDSERFFHAPMIFPYTGKPVPEGWFISEITSTIYFNNRN